MYFCPNCNYSFDISKSSKQEDENVKRALKKSEALKEFENNKDNFTNFKADGFTLEDIQKNPKYKKLTEDDKKLFSVIFQNNDTHLNPEGAQFLCNNCNFIQPITETILLYQYNLTKTESKIISLEENQLICKNPILPRTHDYICKNPDCDSHTKKKEAIFYRDKDSYKINYVCCICYYNW
jgi:Zn finger protein HypA/HybF involved in hydrogenase expression